mgnify:CR=1 FL=1
MYYDNEIDYEKVREKLIDYFGSAMFIDASFAIMNLSQIENASDSQLLEIARMNNIDLVDCKTSNSLKKR